MEIFSVCCVDETRLYLLQRHIKFKPYGMRSRVVQSAVLDVSEVTLPSYLEPNIIRKIADAG